jgi:hypothetical protein
MKVATTGQADPGAQQDSPSDAMVELNYAPPDTESGRRLGRR